MKNYKLKIKSRKIKLKYYKINKNMAIEVELPGKKWTQTIIREDWKW